MIGYVLAIDQGTTGTTILIFDHDGSVKGRAYSEFTQHYPRPGWVEHDATEIWKVTIAVIADAFRSSGIRASDLRAIGITNQRETAVLCDRATSQPVHNAIVWQDRRTAAYCDQLRAQDGLEERIRAKTGLGIDPYFSGTKVRWMLDNVAGLRGRAERGEICFGTIDSWLVWNLTGGRVHATDPTNASRTMLYDIDGHTWSAELCAEFGVPTVVLPEVRPSMGDFGVMAADWCGVELPVLGVAGDQQAALFGHGGWDAGAVKNTYGTGAFLLFCTGE